MTRQLKTPLMRPARQRHEPSCSRGSRARVQADRTGEIARRETAEWDAAAFEKVARGSVRTALRTIVSMRLWTGGGGYALFARFAPPDLVLHTGDSPASIPPKWLTPSRARTWSLGGPIRHLGAFVRERALGARCERRARVCASRWAVYESAHAA